MKFPRFSIYAEQSCLVIVPVAKFCHFFLQSFVCRTELLYQTTSTAACGIPAHEGTKCWKGKGFILKPGVCGGACAVRDSFLEHSSSFMNSHIMLLGKITFSFVEKVLNICRFRGRMKDTLLFSDMLSFLPCI